MSNIKPLQPVDYSYIFFNKIINLLQKSLNNVKISSLCFVRLVNPKSSIGIFVHTKIKNHYNLIWLSFLRKSERKLLNKQGKVFLLK